MPDHASDLSATFRRHPRALGRLELAVAALLFGLMAVTARLATGGPGTFSAGQLVSVRFAIGIACCLALFRARPGTFRPVARRPLVSRGLFGGLGAVFYFISLSLIPAGQATLLNSLHPILATLFAVFFLGERPTLQLAVALLLTSLGVTLVLGGGSLHLSLGWGEAAGLASAVLGAAAITSIRAMHATDNAPTIFFAFCVGGLLFSWPLALGPWPGGAAVWGWALATGLLSVGAQLSMTAAYAFLTVPEAAVWVQLTPLSAFLWGLIFLGETVSPVAGLGVLCALGGIAWGVLRGNRAPGPRPQAPGPAA